MNNNKCNITIQSEDRTISAEPGQSLLEALVESGVLLRADCGGRGRCGADGSLLRVYPNDLGFAAPRELKLAARFVLGNLSLSY